MLTESRDSGGRFAPRHGMIDSPTYHTWRSMHRRCKSDEHAANYRERGIRVCDRWALFENFLADMGERPEGMTIDRRDNDRGYEPGNCRWATSAQQTRNRSFTRLTANLVLDIHQRLDAGESQASVARAIGVAPGTINDVRRGRCWADLMPATIIDHAKTHDHQCAQCGERGHNKRTCRVKP
jgi:hypothetical protein